MDWCEVQLLPVKTCVLASMDENPYKAPQEILATEPPRNPLSFRVGLILLAVLVEVALFALLA